MMKFTFGWLKEHLDTDHPLGEIADKLTMIGLEVERIEDKAKLLAPFVDRARHRGEAASQRRPAARVHGRYRRPAIRSRLSAARRMRAPE